ncbi:cobalamin B12-binding domain-containing protein [Nocardioides mesophilus]|uniref:Cobalamin B12-binding domain-containing protein n=1 Tax=Nocardioides mesophilus TaxID=433659 RepID=A0A7G9RGR7_9ACTN|nr:cobalamin B12-binding domain-containing protein [Nocardioides mesophilus]
MDSRLREAADRFDHAVTTARRDAAVQVVEELLDSGVEAMTVMTDVIAAAQRHVGARWQRGEWSVAQEHAATSVSVAALEAVARKAATGAPHRGHVVVACAEHEWHAMPASIVAAGLRAEGWEVTLLGASTPTARLSRYLRDLGPDVTAVSCSVAAGLPTSRAFIEASTSAGIPVLAGGAAFGTDDRRATALGATAWAADVRSAVETVASLPMVVHEAAPLPAEITLEQVALRHAGHALVDAVAFRWQNRHEALGPVADEDEADLLHETVEQVYHAVVGALITGDGRLVAETAAWVESVLAVRGMPSSAVRDLGRSMAAELDDFPLAASMWQRHWPSAGVGSCPS